MSTEKNLLILQRLPLEVTKSARDLEAFKVSLFLFLDSDSNLNMPLCQRCITRLEAPGSLWLSQQFNSALQREKRSARNPIGTFWHFFLLTFLKLFTLLFMLTNALNVINQFLDKTNKTSESLMAKRMQFSKKITSFLFQKPLS